MAPISSNLSHSSYGYDVVVATTQESINAGLTQYLQNTKGLQPVSYLILLSDSNGDPTNRVSLEDFLKLKTTDNPDIVNPFDIPPNTPDTDKRLVALKKAKFRFAMKLQVGIPPGMIQTVTQPSTNPRSKMVTTRKRIVLPQPIVTLGSSANNVLFNLYCSDVSVLRRIPATDDMPGSWKWSGQKPGKPWYVQTRVDLMVKDLDTNLNTTYFNNRPDEKKALLENLEKLKNLSGSAFSLQQLLFNLDSTVAQTSPVFQDVDDSAIEFIISSVKFIDLWTKAAKEHGEPLISIAAVAKPNDKSSLLLTNMERWVSPIVDGSGNIVSNPSDEQKKAITLNYLCSTDGHSLPAAANFNWNWVEPNDIEQSSGVMAIKRSTIANYLIDQMLKQYSVTSSCKAPWSKVDARDAFGSVYYQCGFNQGTPTVTRHDSGAVVASIEYHPPEARSSDRCVATYGEFNINTSYVCDLVLGTGGNTFTVVQHLVVNFYLQWAATHSSAKVYDTTLTDEYTISVDQNGDLTCTAIDGKSTRKDASTGGDASDAANNIIKINDRIGDIKKQMDDAKSVPVGSINFAQIRSFVFPGAQVFTFKAAQFSQNQDLCALITYVNPTIDQFSETMAYVSTGSAEEDGKQQVETAVLPPVYPAKSVSLQHTTAFVENWRRSNNMFTTAPIIVPEGVSNESEAAVEPEIQVDGNSFIYSAPGAVPDTLSEGKNATTLSTTNLKIELSSSTELMLNHAQIEYVKPEGKFRAVQMKTGNALLFAVNSAGVLSVIEETVGQSLAGWTMKDLSSKFIREHLPDGVASTWDVAQSVMDDGSIGIGMAVRNAQSDTLCLCLLNSASETSWTSAPSWKTVPFDADNAPSPLHITNIYFSETEMKQQYILVDILRDPSKSKATSRYIVDPSAPAGSCWSAHTLPFDVDEGTYQSCMGRVMNALDDGIYTAGTVSNAAQLGYVPLFNSSDDAAPMPTRLAIPNNGVVTAIASARNDQTGDFFGNTDLYAVSGSSLYRWDPAGQLKDNSLGKLIVNNPTIQNTDTLLALTDKGVTTIFGKNSSNNVYYTCCAVARLADPSAWSLPVPISAGVEHITSYINCRDGGNTVYAVGGNQLLQITQSTDASKIWQAHRITIAAPLACKAASFKSYTTLIQVLEGGIPAKDVDTVLTTPNRTPVYINGLYYVLSKDDVTVKTNENGQINIIQATTSIIGAIITATAKGIVEIVNPMHKSLAKLKGLSKSGDLRSAQLVANTTAGGVIGTPRTESLVPSDISDNDIQAAADSMQALGDAYDQHISGSTTSHVSLLRAQDIRLLDIGDDIRVAAGDLFAWLETGVNKAIKIIKDVATNTWHFICTIAGKVYRAILNTVEAVVGAFEWVFDKIKTAVEKVIRYLEFLFDWDDIKRAQKIMHNMAKYYLQDLASTVTVLQAKTDEAVSSIQQSVASLTNVDWTPLGDTTKKPPGGDAVDSSKGQNASSQMMANHFKDQSSSLTITSSLPQTDIITGLIDSLVKAIESEGKVLKQTLDQLESLATDVLKLGVGEILQRLVGILTETALGSAQVVMDALFNVLSKMAHSAVALLDAKIHVPIISDILNALGFEDVSFLDVLTWVAATSFTLVYKVINDRTPFPDNDKCRAMVDAKDWQSLSAVLHGPTIKVATLENTRMVKVGIPKPDLNTVEEDAIYKAGHAITAFLSYGGNSIVGLEAMDQSPDNMLGIPTAVIGIGSAVAAGAADLLVNRLPIKDDRFSWTSRGTLGATILFKVWFSGGFQKKLTGCLQANDPRQASAIINSILVIPAAVCSCWHFYELSKEPESKQRSCAIMGETSSMLSYNGRILYMTAMLQKDPKIRAIPVLGLLATNDVVCGLQTAMSIVSQ